MPAQTESRDRQPLAHTADHTVPHETLGDDKHASGPNLSKDLYKAESVVQDKLDKMIADAAGIKE